jgi:putative endonuclease
MGIAQRRGAAGESLAAAYYELLGGRIVGRNQRLGGVEVDLIVEQDGTLVLVEVKLRGRGDFGGAARAVDRAKAERMRRAARALGADARALRIDVVALEPVDDGLVLRHYRNAITD